MKKLLLLLVSMGLFLVGCQNDDNPVVSNVASTQEAIPLVLESGFLDLPEMKQTNSNVMNGLTDADLINGKKGGELEIDGKMGVSRVGSVEVEGSLEIPGNSFSGTKIIWMSADRGTTSLTLGPSGSTFSKSLILNLKYDGLNLDGIDVSTIKFAYLGSDGNVYPVQYNSLEVDAKEGSIKVTGAQIDHFSRFGFVR